MGEQVASELVAQRFPDARAAWLGGSVAPGTATSTSDLDITVLLAGPPAPMRESLFAGFQLAGTDPAELRLR
jgi:predicted nucleotidyltransferase